MRILGIDPGSVNAGFAIIDVEGRKVNVVTSGVISLGKEGDFFSRLIVLNQKIREIVKEFRPNECALESLIYVKNVNSMAKLSQARGAMISALSELSGENIFEYSPNLVKSMISGHGHSSKEAIEKMVKLFTGSGHVFKTSDESDALAIAICHSLLRNQGATKVSTVGKKARSIKDHFKHLAEKKV